MNPETETAAEAAAEPATETTSAAPEAAASESGSNESGSEGGESQRFSIAELEAKHARCEELTPEEMAWYANADEMEDIAPAAAEPKPEEKEPEEAAKHGIAIEAAMKELGAKSVEEVPAKLRDLRNAHSQQAQAAKSQKQINDGIKILIDGIKNGDGNAAAQFSRIFGVNIGGQPQPQTPAQQQQAQAARMESMKNFSKEMFIDEQEGEKFLSFIDGKFSELEGRAKEFQEIKRDIEWQKQQARQSEVQFTMMNDLAEFAELHKEEFGLDGIPVRAALEQLAQGKDSEKLQSLKGFILEYADRDQKYLHLSMGEYYKLANFDKYGEKLAQARIEAQNSAKKSVFNGVKQNRSAAAASSPSLSDSDIDAMITGKRGIPADFFTDEDRVELDPKKAPQKLLAAWAG